jgi:septation ring formation regulator EzrA
MSDENVSHQLELLTQEVRAGFRAITTQLQEQKDSHSTLVDQVEQIKKDIATMQLEAERMKSRMLMGVIGAILAGGGTAGLARLFGVG